MTSIDTDRARAAGAYAARRQLPVTACPYDPADPQQRTLAANFVRGYLHQRPPTQVDYNGDDDE